MDLSTFLILLSVLAIIFTSLLVFLAIRKILSLIFDSHSASHSNPKFSPNLEVPITGQIYTYSTQTSLDSAEFEVVDVPRLAPQELSVVTKFSGKEEIDLDEPCLITRKSIRNCNCDDCQKLSRRVQWW